MRRDTRKVLSVVMDGIGERDSDFGNAVNLANTPYIEVFKAKWDLQTD